MTRPDFFEQDFNVQLDARDKARIDATATEQSLAYAEFLRQADEYGIDPQPVPHIHTPHQEIADRSYWAMAFAHGGGITVAAAWSALTATNALVGTTGGVLIYMIVAFGLDLFFSAFWPRTSFFQLFKWMVLAAITLLFPASIIVLMARFANPELAKTLTQYDPYAWTTMEIALLVLGALSFTATRRYRWSNSLKRDYDECERLIVNLRQQIDRRAQVAATHASNVTAAPTLSKSPTLPIIAVFASLLASGLAISTAKADCPAAIVDQTGSIANQIALEDRVVVNLAKLSGGVPCLTLIPVSAHMFSAERREIHFEKPRPALFQPMQDALDQQRRSAAESMLRSALRERLPAAACTSITDMLTLATHETSALIVTDGEHTCGTAADSVIGEGKSVVVILGRSIHDRGNDSDAFRMKRAFILRRLPGAHVFGEFELERGVQQWFGLLGPGISVVRTSS